MVNTKRFFYRKKKLVKWGGEILFKEGKYPTCPDGWGERLMKREYKTPN